MTFLIDINRALREESTLDIKIRKMKGYTLIKVVDSKNNGVKSAVLTMGSKKLGITDDKGVLKVENKELPRKGSVKAVIGIYSTVKSFNF